MSVDLTNITDAYQKLQEIAVTPEINFEALATEVLNIARHVLGMEVGIVSEVEEDSYYIYAITANTMGLTVGQKMELGDTLCREVFEKRCLICHHDMEKSQELRGHPAYKNLGFNSYIGTPIWLGSKLFGTLNFSSSMKRQEDFSKEEKNVFNTMALLLAKQLEIDLLGQTNALILKNLTHELRTPLNGIIGSLEILADTEFDQEQFELFDLIKRSADAMTTAVDDLSLFIKVNRDLVSTTLTAQSPLELTINVLKVVKPKFKQNDIFFNHLEDSKTPLILTSPNIFSAVLTCLFAECQSRQRKRKELEISYEETHRFVHVVIKDNGPILSSNVVDLINNFGRIEYSSKSFTTQGVNLNLTLAVILIQLVGGLLRIEIKKEDNNFVLSFPKA